MLWFSEVGDPVQEDWVAVWSMHELQEVVRGPCSCDVECEAVRVRLPRVLADYRPSDHRRFERTPYGLEMKMEVVEVGRDQEVVRAEPGTVRVDMRVDFYVKGSLEDLPRLATEKARELVGDSLWDVSISANEASTLDDLWTGEVTAYGYRLL